MVILSLNQKGSQEDPHLSGESSALTLDLLVEALFCLDLKSISETELSIFAPFCGIVWIISQVIHEVLLRIFHVTDGVKLMGKSVELLLVGLSEALINQILLRQLDILKLRHDVAVEVGSLTLGDGSVKALLGLSLEEDVQLSLE